MEAVFRPAGGGHQVLARDIARNYRSKHVTCFDVISVCIVANTFLSRRELSIISYLYSTITLGHNSCYICVPRDRVYTHRCGFMGCEKLWGKGGVGCSFNNTVEFVMNVVSFTPFRSLCIQAKLFCCYCQTY